jgi:hypothetical protein
MQMASAEIRGLPFIPLAFKKNFHVELSIVPRGAEMKLQNAVGEYAVAVRTAYFRALALALDMLFDDFCVFDFEWDWIRPFLGAELPIPAFRRLDREMGRRAKNDG